LWVDIPDANQRQTDISTRGPAPASARLLPRARSRRRWRASRWRCWTWCSSAPRPAPREQP